MTVQPHQLERYSFLEPLRELGAETCYVWPIIVGSEVAAMLSVGYRGHDGAVRGAGALRRCSALRGCRSRCRTRTAMSSFIARHISTR